MTEAMIGVGPSACMHDRDMLENDRSVAVELVDAADRPRTLAGSLRDLAGIGLTMLKRVEAVVAAPLTGTTGCRASSVELNLPFADHGPQRARSAVPAMRRAVPRRSPTAGGRAGRCSRPSGRAGHLPDLVIFGNGDRPSRHRPAAPNDAIRSSSS